jgi:hypothetical protein
MNAPNRFEVPKANATTPSPDPSVMHKTGKLRKDKHPTASLLFGVAVIQFLVAFFFWSIHGSEFTSLDWAYSLSFLVFVALGIWARCAPAVPATIGFLLYAAYLGMQAALSLELLRSGWTFKLPTAVFLAIAFGYGFLENGRKDRH